MGMKELERSEGRKKPPTTIPKILLLGIVGGRKHFFT